MSLLGVVEEFARHAVRFRTPAGVILASQNVLIDVEATGTLPTNMGLLGNPAGFAGTAGVVRIYCAPSIDVDVGYVFTHDGVKYTIEFVGPSVGIPGEDDCIKMAFASATRS